MDDKDHIELAEIGMKFGAGVAVALVLLASGIGVLFTIILESNKQIVDQFNQPCIASSTHPCMVLPIGGMIPSAFILIFAGIVLFWFVIARKNERMSSLRERILPQPEQVQQENISNENCRPSFWLSKRHHGIELCPPQNPPIN